MTTPIRRPTPPRDRRTCARQPCARPAEVVFGARAHCLSCANEARAFVDRVREREGSDVVLAVTVP